VNGLVAQIDEPDQTVAVAVEEDVVALLIFFPPAERPQGA
jgi:hypothetical protein